MGVIRLFTTNIPAELIIVRHAEAVKNLERIHGGGKQDLTVVGQAQAKSSAKMIQNFLDERGAGVVKIYFQEEKRSEYTALILGEMLGVTPVLAEGIFGVGLGIIAELNENELSEQFPEVAKALSDWRCGESGLKRYPKIPGSESMTDFAERISLGLEKIIQPGDCSIIVGTTSVINMLNHLMQKEGQFIRDEYEFVQYPKGGINVWRLSLKCGPKIIYSNF